MPGRKDFVSVKQSEGRLHVQKRLILCTLRELYQVFEDQYPTEKIGFTKFAELRPKHCVLAGASGTHSVCVCTIHQNIKLMLLGANIHHLTIQDDVPLKTYNHQELQEFYFGKCVFCPGTTVMKDRLTEVLDDNLIDHITYKQWIATRMLLWKMCVVSRYYCVERPSYKSV